MEGYNMMSDAEIVSMALHGDSGAKEELLDRCKDVTSYHVQKYRGLFFGRLNHFDVEDLISECHLAILESVELYDPNRDSGFPTFARFIVRTRIIGLLRRKNTERRIFYQPEDIDRLKAPQQNETIKNLQISSLVSPKEKEIIALILSGESQSDVAKMFKVNKSTITRILQKVVR